MSIPFWKSEGRGAGPCSLGSSLPDWAQLGLRLTKPASSGTGKATRWGWEWGWELTSDLFLREVAWRWGCEPRMSGRKAHCEQHRVLSQPPHHRPLVKGQ